MEDPQIDIACGVVVVANGRILLVKHTKECGGLFSIPKGRLEPNEDIRACALRELKEETGIVLRATDLSLFPEVLHIMDREDRVVKRVYYFTARIDWMNVLRRGESVKTWDTAEIESIHTLSFEEAEARLPISQLSVLHHIDYGFSVRELLFLLKTRLVTRSLDLRTGLYLYNYSQRCKEAKYWNFTTLSCRGLVLDRNFNVIARPFKKFFEWRQLPIELQSYLLSCQSGLSIKSYDKLDGTLIILFNYDGQWVLTNRRKWNLIQSIQAEVLFNQMDSHGFLAGLDPNLTYLFESTVHYPYNVVAYDAEQLVLLCAVNKANGDIHSPESLASNLPKVQGASIGEFNSIPTKAGIEGYVFHLDSRYTIKAKSHWYHEAVSRIDAGSST